MKSLKLLIMSLAVSTSFISGSSLLAKDANWVGKILLIRGKVVAAKEGSKQTRVLKKGDKVAQDDVLQSDKSSFAKVLFKDKSSINLGPESKIKLDSFHKSEAGMISLLYGKIRSEVSKDLRVPASNNKKSKFFIKTKNAAMGVRGTMWDVSYNKVNKNSLAVIYRGEVAMAKLEKHVRNRTAMDILLNSKKAVRIRKGRFAMVSPTNRRASLPVKISPAQFAALKHGGDFGTDPNKKPVVVKEVKQKKYRKLTPPGLDPKKVSTKRKVGVIKGIPPEGKFDRKTGIYAPPAGGYVDLETAIYVKPPQGSSFDSNTKTYIPPRTLGSFDPQSGKYLGPKVDGIEYKLTPKGEFIPRGKPFIHKDRVPAHDKKKKHIKKHIKIGPQTSRPKLETRPSVPRTSGIIPTSKPSYPTKIDVNLPSTRPSTTGGIIGNRPPVIMNKPDVIINRPKVNPYEHLPSRKPASVITKPQYTRPVYTKPVLIPRYTPVPIRTISPVILKSTDIQIRK